MDELLSELINWLMTKVFVDTAPAELGLLNSAAPATSGLLNS